MGKKVSVVILAAGKGTRMKSLLPKPLVECLDQTLIDFVLSSVFHFIKDSQVEAVVNVITGHKRELVEDYLNNKYKQESFNYIYQAEQRGTGHALQCYFEQYPQAFDYDYTLILCADTPLVKSFIYKNLFDLITTESLDGAVATMVAKDPFGYGRIVKADKGFSIVEQKDADEETLKITEVNSGIYLFKTSYIERHLNSLSDNNASGELYLTDLCAKDRNITASCFDNEKLFLGVNTFQQLEEAEHILIKEITTAMMSNGVRFQDSQSVIIGPQVRVEPGSFIGRDVQLLGQCSVDSGCRIEAGSIIVDSTLESHVHVKAYSYLESSHIHSKATIGPFAHLRPGSDIGSEAKIGNFVEVKKAKLEKGVKVSHLSYVGDAEIGENTNIGCGFITCNYDGANKHLTKIGKDCFVGSDSQMIAPIELGDNCYVGSGSTINQSMPSGSFAIARARQVTKENMAKKFIKKKK